MRALRAAFAAGVLVVLTGCLVRSPSSTFPGGRGGAPGEGYAPVRPALDEETLGDLVLLWKARDAQLAGDPTAVREAATAAHRQGDLPDARRWLAEALPRLGETTPQWQRGAVVLAEINVHLGAEQTALRLAKSVREKHPRGVADRRARRLTDRVIARRPDLVGAPEQQLADAMLRLREGDAAWAASTADRVAAAGGDLGVRALLVRAQAERALGRGATAEATCKLVARTAPPSEAAEALALAARWRWNADDDRGAELLYERARRRAPGTAVATEATYALGRIAQERGEWARAARAYDEVAGSDDSSLARTGRWASAWVWYLGGDWPRAAAGFAALAARDDADALAARYWQARTLERAGDPTGALLLQQLAVTKLDTYYGWMAGRRLGRPSPPAGPVAPPERPPFPPTLQSPHARRARALLELGLPQLARHEVDALRGTEDPEVLVGAYEAIGVPEAAMRLAASLPRTDATRRHLYPLGYWDVVRTAAESYGLDPLLVQALIRQESAFAPQAVSAVDAQGLMQLLPSTASEVAVAQGLPPPDREHLTDVGTNVALGTALLRRLLTQYGGSEIKALAAYNAGEDAVRKWEGRYGERDDDEFVELISFRETKRYVKSVLENYQVYRALYVPPSAVASDRGSPPKAPLDMMTMTSPARADATR
jgi:soluble lytic murein transglycosylase-like protein